MMHGQKNIKYRQCHLCAKYSSSGCFVIQRAQSCKFCLQGVSP